MATMISDYRDFFKYHIFPIITVVSWRKDFTGWRAERVMTEHQFIFLYRGKGKIIINQETYEVKKGDLIYLAPGDVYDGLTPENQESIDFYLIQFTYLLVENRRPGWQFKSDKNFSVMDQEHQYIIHEGTAGLPYEKIQNMVNYAEVYEILFDLKRLEDREDEESLWEQQLKFSRLFYEITENQYKYLKFPIQKKRSEQIRVYLEEHFAQTLKIETIAQHFGISRGYLMKIFKDDFGLSPMAYQNQIRIQKAKELLRDTNEEIYMIAEQVGFCDAYYFSKKFKRFTGMRPLEYRRSIARQLTE